MYPIEEEGSHVAQAARQGTLTRGEAKVIDVSYNGGEDCVYINVKLSGAGWGCPFGTIRLPRFLCDADIVNLPKGSEINYVSTSTKMSNGRQPTAEVRNTEGRVLFRLPNYKPS